MDLTIFPNPFSGFPTTRFRLIQPKEQVIVEVCNIKGHCVKELMNATIIRGFYELTWFGNDEDGHDLDGGIYLLQVHTGEQTFTRKIILVR